MTRTRSWGVGAVVFLTLGVSLSGCAGTDQTGTNAPTTAPQVPPPYSRAAFGTGWPVVHGTCTVRSVILERDAGPAAFDSGDGCRDAGPIVDLYTGETINPKQAQIDHVLSLEQAWVEGAWKWTPQARHTFYLDQANLRAVSGTINDQKGSKSPATWRPPAKSGWCGYAMTYESTATRWHLPVTPEDTEALSALLDTCPAPIGN